MIVNSEEIVLKVGFEIHQQLLTKTKLFCNCNCLEPDNYDSYFFRKYLMRSGISSFLSLNGGIRNVNVLIR